MDIKDIIQLLGIGIALALGILSAVITIQNDRKLRAVSLITSRRKERFENLRVFSAKFIALASPDTISDHARIAQTSSYIENIREVTMQLLFLLDYRYDVDRGIMERINSISEQAMALYHDFIEGTATLTSKEETKPVSDLTSGLQMYQKQIMAYILAEWVRIKDETTNNSTDWTTIYKKHISLYDEKMM